MVVAGYLVELLFTPLHLVPQTRDATVTTASISWNYTTWLNIVFLLVAAALFLRFVRTGGLPRLRMMGGDPQSPQAESAQAMENKPTTPTAYRTSTTRESTPNPATRCRGRKSRPTA